MKILLDDKTPLKLDHDFELNIQVTNPLLTDQGSMSLPLKLPISNAKELDFPDRWDRYYKLTKKRQATIQSGVMRKNAALEILSYNQKEGIEAVLLLNEAKMYTQMQEVSMSSAFAIVRKAEDLKLSGSFATPLDKLIKYLELVMLGQIKDDFLLFPVATDSFEEEYTTPRPSGTNSRTIYNLLNEQMSLDTRGSSDQIMDTDLKGNKYKKLRGRNAFRVKTSSDEFDVPKGYGITPFLKENFVLRRIFYYFGYELATSIFDTDPDLSRMVLINNTADTVVKSQIDYTHLVPSCSIHDYLETVRNRFGCEFFVTENQKTVVPVFWKDILSSSPTKDFTSKIDGALSVEYVVPKSLKLCYKRSLEQAQTSVDTISKFEREYGKLKGYIQGVFYVSEPLANGFYFSQEYCAIYERYSYVSQGNSHQAWRFVTKAMFDHYDDDTDMELEEKTGTPEYTPLIDGYIHFTEDYETSIRKVFNSKFLFIGSRRHVNTNIQVTVTNETGGVETTQKKEEPGECKIMTAFWVVGNALWGLETNIPMGTMHRYDAEGKAVGAFDLTFGGDYGLYHRFWKDYDHILNNSFLKISGRLDLDELDIINFRMDEPVLIQGQALLPELLEYTLDEKGVLTNKLEFRTLRLYEDKP